eukprot:1374397-Prymnesium_polylepis.1
MPTPGGECASLRRSNAIARGHTPCGAHAPHARIGTAGRAHAAADASSKETSSARCETTSPSL